MVLIKIEAQCTKVFFSIWPLKEGGLISPHPISKRVKKHHVLHNDILIKQSYIMHTIVDSHAHSSLIHKT
jgi:hypothetical protein